MKVMKAAGRLLATLGASATVVLGMVSCVPRNDDINQVQPGFVRKAIFQTEDEWYYRRTIVKSETTNSIAVEGMGDMVGRTHQVRNPRERTDCVQALREPSRFGDARIRRQHVL